MKLLLRRQSHDRPLLTASLALSLALSGSAAWQSASAQVNERKNPEQYYRAPNSIQGKTLVLPIGTTFEGRIDTSIGSSMSRQGQTFTISMSAPLLANGVDVLIPAGSQILGEVVEAIPSSHLEHKKGFPKPTGKLRVQLNGLRTPDGVSYPLVASLAGESLQTGRNNVRPNQSLGASVGYVGSQASFEAVSQQMQAKARMGNRPGAPEVITRQKMMNDPIYGIDQFNRNQGNGKQVIRSLVKHGHDLVIVSGSPVTVRLDAPFKIGLAPPAAQMETYSAPTESVLTGGRRFAPAGSSRAAASEPAAGQAAPHSDNPLPGILPDVPHRPDTVQSQPGQLPPMLQSQPPPGGQTYEQQGQGTVPGVPQSGAGGGTGASAPKGDDF